MASSPPPDAAPPSGDEQQAALKRKRNLPGTPDPQAEVIALSPRTLMATNRFLCEVCGKGFQRDQNLQLHRRGHNLPWKLKQREGQDIKKRVYVCPVVTCAHHEAARALGDLTGIKKHFSRKHGEKKWKCEKCSKRYAVHSDWKAHQKVCGTREYRCDCGTLFSRRDSFITHRAFCEALTEENARVSAYKQIEPDQSSEGNTVTNAAGELFDASSSSFSQLTSGEAPHSDVLEPLVSDGCRLGSQLNDSRGSFLTAGKGQVAIAVASQESSKGPGLSLSLGTGLGPGPPCAADTAGCLQQSEARAARQMDRHLTVDSVRDDRTQWPLPFADAGIFTSMLSASNSDLKSQGYGTGRHASNGMAGLSVGMKSLITSSPPLQFGCPPYLANGFMSSEHHRQHTGSAQLPATTLLQKAAMMGSTKSSSFFFRNFGGAGDLRASSPEESQQPDSWAGLACSQSSSWHSSLSMRPATEHLRLHGGPGYEGMRAGGPHRAGYGGQENSLEFRESACDRGAANAASSSFDLESSFMVDGNRRVRYSSDSLHEGFRSQDGGVTCTDLEGSQANERHEDRRLTLDFLGIGGHGVGTGMGQASSQRELTDKTSLIPGIKPEPINYLPDRGEAED